jgi:hypothetical protein
MNSSDYFSGYLTDSALDLTAVEQKLWTKIRVNLLVLGDELRKQMQQLDIDAGPNYQRTRVESLIRSANRATSISYERSSRILDKEMRKVSVFKHKETIGIFNKVFKVDLLRPTINFSDLKATASNAKFLGGPAKSWWEGQARSTKTAFAREVRQGFLQGETNSQVIARVTGKPNGRRIRIPLANGKTRVIKDRVGGILQTSRNHAHAITTTALQKASNDSIAQTYKENSDVLRGVEALTTLDGRTTDICMSRTGGSWSLDTGDPLPESEVSIGFPGFPPWHWRCRTILSPITKSWDDLIEEASGSRRKILNTVPNSHRTNFDGMIANDVRTFDDWLRLRGDTFARGKLGSGRFDLWKSGKINTRQLVSNSGRSLTIDELEALSQ